MGSSELTAREVGRAWWLQGQAAGQLSSAMKGMPMGKHTVRCVLHSVLQACRSTRCKQQATHGSHLHYTRIASSGIA
jgi:hypothetical protein